MEGPGIESLWSATFSVIVQTGPGAHPASCTMGTGLLPGIKRPGRGVNLLYPFSRKVKERVQLYLCYPSLPSWQDIEWSLPFLIVGGESDWCCRLSHGLRWSGRRSDDTSQRPNRDRNCGCPARVQPSSEAVFLEIRKTVSERRVMYFIWCGNGNTLWWYRYTLPHTHTHTHTHTQLCAHTAIPLLTYNLCSRPHAFCWSVSSVTVTLTLCSSHLHSQLVRHCS